MPENYKTMLEKNGLSATENRLDIIEILGKSSSPLTAQEVYDTLRRTRNVNRVTVYRILDLLLEKHLIERVSGGDRAFRFGLPDRKDGHPHFFCTRCGNMECLDPGSIRLDVEGFKRVFTGTVDKVEIRLDGLCKNCLKKK